MEEAWRNWLEGSGLSIGEEGVGGVT